MKLSALTTRLSTAWHVVRSGSLPAPFNKLFTSGTATQLTNPAANSAYVSACLDAISGPISTRDLDFTLTLQDGTEVQDADPRLAQLWKRPAISPTGPLTLAATIEHTISWHLLTGSAFWLLPDDYLAPFPQIAQLPPFRIARPSSMIPVMRDGTLVAWRHTPTGGKTEILAPEQVLHFSKFSQDDQARSSYDAAKLAAEADYAAARFLRESLNNAGDTGSYLIAKGGIPTQEQQDQIRNALREKRRRAQLGQFSDTFLTGDITIEDPKVRAPDANLVAQRLQNREEIAIAFGLPPGTFTVQASYSIGSASDRYRVLTDTVIPLATKLAHHITHVAQLQTKRPVEASFDWDDHPVLQAVRRERLASISTLASQGMPMKHISDYLGLDLPEYPGWDTGYIPFGLQPLGTTPATGPQDPTTDPTYAEPTPPPADPITEALRALRLGARSPSSAPASETTPIHYRAPDAELWKLHMARRRPSLRRTTKAIQDQLAQARQETLALLAKAPADLFKSASANQESRIKNQESHRAAAADLLFDLSAYQDGLLASLRSQAAATLQTAGTQLYDEISRDDPYKVPPAEVTLHLARRQNLLRDVPTETHNRVKAAIQAGLDAGDSRDQIAARINQVFDAETTGRATVIAQTEVNAAYGAGRQIAMQTAGITHKQWLTSGNTNVRPSHRAANGLTVRITEPYLVGGHLLDHPGDSKAPPHETINCHCVSIPVEDPNAQN